jgi:peptide/nickel transport system ATP-binding protein
MSTPVLTVEGLSVVYPTEQSIVAALRDVSFVLGRERLGIVGESGSGKSTLGRAIMGMVPPPGRVTARMMRLDHIDLRTLSERQFARLRGRRISMILQDPKYSLNPVMTVGTQITEAYRAHFAGGSAKARCAALEILAAVQIRDPERIMALYPHQISGGMGQRVMIAMMLIGEPKLLIADEPTSALDVTVQRSVLTILDELIRRRGMSLILISHNLPLVATFCDRILVMYGGRILETCVASRLSEAKHPYTRGLISALPSLQKRRGELPQLTRDSAWLEP